MAALKITIDAMYDFGDTVYLKTDRDQLPRLVTGYVMRPSSLLMYRVTHIDNETPHYDFELSPTPVYVNKQEDE